MKKKYFPSFCTFALLLILATGCASDKQAIFYAEPALTSINIIDRNGLSETVNNPDRLEQYENVDFLQPQPYQKVLRIFTRDPEGNIPSYITSYHPNGYPKQYLQVVNSRAYGIYKEWSPNGVQKINANVIEGLADITEEAERTWVFDGCCQVWNENGSIEASILYCKGQLEGASTYYHSNGYVWKVIPYHQNKIDGILEIYREDGSLLQKTTYQEDVKDGESQRYWQGGLLAAEESYCRGLLSFGQYFNPKGECIANIVDGNGVRAIFGKECVCELHEYLGGVLEGEVKVFDKYGQLIKLYHIKNGWKHGEETWFYEAVRLKQKILPKLTITWFEGKIQGLVKTWYDTGVQESQKEMSNNKKNGHSTAWYRDGSLMMIEVYLQDKLTRGEYYSIGERSPTSFVLDGNGEATIFDSDGNFVRKVKYNNGKPVIEE